MDQIASTLPLGRPAGAEEIAAAIVYLASDGASYITGAIVPVRRGSHCRWITLWPAP